MNDTKYLEIENIFSKVVENYPLKQDGFEEIFSRLAEVKLIFVNNPNDYMFAYAQLWNDERTVFTPRITLNLFYFKNPEKLFAYIKSDRPHSLKIIAQKLRVTEEFLESNAYLVALFVFLHELGHILHFEKYMEENDSLMKINPNDVIGMYQFTHGEEPLSKLPIPNIRPAEISDREDRLKQEASYRLIEVEAFSDDYAAMVLNNIINPTN